MCSAPDMVAGLLPGRRQSSAALAENLKKDLLRAPGDRLPVAPIAAVMPIISPGTMMPMLAMPVAMRTGPARWRDRLRLCERCGAYCQSDHGTREERSH